MESLVMSAGEAPPRVVSVVSVSQEREAREAELVQQVKSLHEKLAVANGARKAAEAEAQRLGGTTDGFSWVKEGRGKEVEDVQYIYIYTCMYIYICSRSVLQKCRSCLVLFCHFSQSPLPYS